MSEKRQIRDPVFNFIPVQEKEGDIINTKIFQRLRGIRQLAFANLVYPGALHTRFEHSLGVCHIAGMLAKQLNFDEEEKSLIRLGALLHDLGHGPFSHISEEALELYTDRTTFSSDKYQQDKIHELLTAEIIRRNPDLVRIIGQNDCEKIIQLLNEGYREPIFRALISGPLDADKQDYLLRDSHFCGVKYGLFDIAQLHGELRAIEESGERQLAITGDGVHALEQFILAKYYLITQIYKHRIRLITDQMLIRAVVLGIEDDEIDDLRQLYSYDASDSFISRYTNFDDARFLLKFADDKFKGKYCHTLLYKLQWRDLLKRIYKKRIGDLPEKCRDPLSNISKPEYKSKRKNLETTIYAALEKIIKDNNCGELIPDGSDSNFLIIHAYTIKSVREQSRNDEGTIIIEGKPPKTFEEESVLFKSINESESEPLVEVYAPVSYNSSQKKLLLEISDEKISKVLDSFFSTEVNSADT